MKKTTKPKTVAKKKGGKKFEPVVVASKTEPTPIVAVTSTTPPAEKYTVVMKMGAMEYEATGNDESVFMSLKPEKVTTKCVFLIINNETGKTYEKTLPPFLARKLVVNSLVQKVQWKIMAGKVA
jgi:hypothetical protein